MKEIIVRQSLINHRRTMTLARQLSEDRFASAGRVVALWLWALDNAPGGDLGVDFSDFAGEIVGHTGDVGDLMVALLSSGWVLDTRSMGADDDEATFLVADWDESDGPISRFIETDPNE